MYVYIHRGENTYGQCNIVSSRLYLTERKQVLYRKIQASFIIKFYFISIIILTWSIILLWDVPLTSFKFKRECLCKVWITFIHSYLSIRMLNDTLVIIFVVCLRCLCFYAISLLLNVHTPCGYLKKIRFNLARYVLVIY